MNPFQAGMRFRAELRRTAGIAAGFDVPAEVVTELGGGHPRVLATVNGYRFPAAIRAHRLTVGPWRRAAARITAGHAYDIDVELDLPRRHASRFRTGASASA
ncbi:DUF1905 domain-containing protein [Actinoplanes sp. N902-109]|uniref:DUF1905 domain-containing protein n=1 Tax=Actinoplanes sp. (strain N902-109) TaxID=649831 RepID=UPI0003296753|nr:DUF1905 domain-containing protein [Actinoplanes sp. N902-109]AGL20097.1 hypothetical protein L083_6587 [Actinoplanes sp. N902-109]